MWSKMIKYREQNRTNLPYAVTQKKTLKFTTFYFKIN